MKTNSIYGERVTVASFSKLAMTRGLLLVCRPVPGFSVENKHR